MQASPEEQPAFKTSKTTINAQGGIVLSKDKIKFMKA
jgi:hypothetical protein